MTTVGRVVSKRQKGGRWSWSTSFDWSNAFSCWSTMYSIITTFPFKARAAKRKNENLFSTDKGPRMPAFFAHLFYHWSWSCTMQIVFLSAELLLCETSSLQLLTLKSIAMRFECRLPTLRTYQQLTLLRKVSAINIWKAVKYARCSLEFRTRKNVGEGWKPKLFFRRCDDRSE